MYACVHCTYFPNHVLFLAHGVACLGLTAVVLKYHYKHYKTVIT